MKKEPKGNDPKLSFIFFLLSPTERTLYVNRLLWIINETHKQHIGYMNATGKSGIFTRIGGMQVVIYCIMLEAHVTGLKRQKTRENYVIIWRHITSGSFSRSLSKYKMCTRPLNKIILLHPSCARVKYPSLHFFFHLGVFRLLTE